MNVPEPRVRLVPLGSEHYEEYVALRRESRDFLAPWEPWPPPDVDPYAREAFEEMLLRSKESASLKYLVIRNQDERLVGSMNLNNVVRGVFQCANLGYWTGAPFARQGYMTEALRLTLGECFERQELHRVEANIMPHNHASLALVARAGFRKEGFSPRFLKIADQWRDHERWALLADEYRARETEL